MNVFLPAPECPATKTNCLGMSSAITRCQASRSIADLDRRASEELHKSDHWAVPSERLALLAASSRSRLSRIGRSIPPSMSAILSPVYAATIRAESITSAGSLTLSSPGLLALRFAILAGLVGNVASTLTLRQRFYPTGLRNAAIILRRDGE